MVFPLCASSGFPAAMKTRVYHGHPEIICASADACFALKGFNAATSLLVLEGEISRAVYAVVGEKPNMPKFEFAPNALGPCALLEASICRLCICVNALTTARYVYPSNRILERVRELDEEAPKYLRSLGVSLLFACNCTRYPGCFQVPPCAMYVNLTCINVHSTIYVEFLSSHHLCPGSDASRWFEGTELCS